MKTLSLFMFSTNVFLLLVLQIIFYAYALY
jgi:hypothetical protein